MSEGKEEYIGRQTGKTGFRPEKEKEDYDGTDGTFWTGSVDNNRIGYKLM